MNYQNFHGPKNDITLHKAGLEAQTIIIKMFYPKKSKTLLHTDTILLVHCAVITLYNIQSLPPIPRPKFKRNNTLKLSKYASIYMCVYIYIYQFI